MSKVRRGNCYVTCEALYHLLGGKKAGWVPHYVKHEGDTHWFLTRWSWNKSWVIRRKQYKSVKYKTLVQILDPTRKQFKTPPNYSDSRGSGFLTKRPSKRARKLMKEMLWQK